MANADDKKLYIVHLGFYDQETNFGVYESHTNVFVAASTPQEAKLIAKAMPMYKNKKMHTDGIQEITAVQGFRVKLEPDASLDNDTVLNNFDYTQLNPANP